MAQISASRPGVMLRPQSIAVQAMVVIAGSLLLWLSAKMQLPFWPVPMTLQVMAIFTLVGVLGLRLGALSVALYIAEGAMGLPVFAGTPQKGIGLAYMMGPTGGYILGFMLGAIAIGWLAGQGWTRHPLRLFAAFMIGLALIYLPGLAWLAQFTGWDKAMALGFWPFIGGDILKAAIPALALPALWRWIGN